MPRQELPAVMNAVELLGVLGDQAFVILLGGCLLQCADETEPDEQERIILRSH